MKKTPRLPRLFGRLLPSILVLALCLAQAASAAGIRLSGSTAVYGEVKTFQLASKTGYAVYFTLETDYTPHLFSVRLNGAPPVELTVAPPAQYEYYTMEYKITPDGTRVLYTANQENINAYSLYSIPIAGGTPVRLSASAVSAGYISISSDSQWVYFAGYSGSTWRLYRAPVTGGTGSAVAISPAGATSGMYEDLAVTPDGTRIVFLGRVDPLSGGWGIYSIPVTGGTPVRLTPPMTAQWVLDFLITPDSQKVVMRIVDEGNGDLVRLYAVPIVGPYTNYINVSGSLVAGGGVYNGFKISPNGKYVVFVADKEVLAKYELYSYYLATPNPNLTAPVKLNVSIANDRDVSPYGFQISPNSSRVVYFAYQNNLRDLFSVPLGVANPIPLNVKLNNPLNPSFNVSWEDALIFMPDSSRVIYTSMQTTVDYVDLYSIPITGPAAAAIKINPAQWMSPGGFAWVHSPRVSADGRFVIYLMAYAANRTDLMLSPVTGPADQSVNLSEISYSGGSVITFSLAPASGKVVYQASQFSAAKELFMVNVPINAFLPVVRR